jgi:hypothetical protein
MIHFNSDFLIITYLISLFVDWVFQSDYDATHKSKWGKNDNKWNSFFALTSHSVTYASITSILVTLILGYHTEQAVILLIALFITHAIIDTRILVKLIMKLKGMSEEQISDHANFGFMHIGIDHRLHELVIIILSFFM